MLIIDITMLTIIVDDFAAEFCIAQENKLNETHYWKKSIFLPIQLAYSVEVWISLRGTHVDECHFVFRHSIDDSGIESK